MEDNMQRWCGSRSSAFDISEHSLCVCYLWRACSDWSRCACRSCRRPALETDTAHRGRREKWWLPERHTNKNCEFSNSKVYRKHAYNYEPQNQCQPFKWQFTSNVPIIVCLMCVSAYLKNIHLFLNPITFFFVCHLIFEGSNVLLLPQGSSLSPSIEVSRRILETFLNYPCLKSVFAAPVLPC